MSQWSFDCNDNNNTSNYFYQVHSASLRDLITFLDSDLKSSYYKPTRDLKLRALLPTLEQYRRIDAQDADIAA